jgi:hypothetical protein
MVRGFLESSTNAPDFVNQETSWDLGSSVDGGRYGNILFRRFWRWWYDWLCLHPETDLHGPAAGAPQTEAAVGRQPQLRLLPRDALRRRRLPRLVTQVNVHLRMTGGQQQPGLASGLAGRHT